MRERERHTHTHTHTQRERENKQRIKKEKYEIEGREWQRKRYSDKMVLLYVFVTKLNKTYHILSAH